MESEQVKVITPEELEKERVAGAVRTDIILSAEIMAIAYSQVTDQPVINQIAVMARRGRFYYRGRIWLRGLHRESRRYRAYTWPRTNSTLLPKNLGAAS